MTIKEMIIIGLISVISGFGMWGCGKNNMQFQTNGELELIHDSTDEQLSKQESSKDPSSAQSSINEEVKVTDEQ